MQKTILCLLALGLTAGCTPRSAAPPGPVVVADKQRANAAGAARLQTSPSSKSPRFLALGDSYTCGESVEPSLRWPVQLSAFLKAVNIDAGDPQIIAQTGWTTGDLLAAMEAATLQPTYEMVTVLIGVNNQYRGGEIGQYRTELTRILQSAKQLAGGNSKHVIVLSIPDWGVTPFAARQTGDPSTKRKISADIDRFNAVNREETERLGAHYIDITPISRQAPTQPDLIARDGLHPSGKMYALWAKKTLTAIKVARNSDPSFLRRQDK